ncbi:MAG: NADH-quinone oxidoreductase subunit C [Acidimicrobiia bacterium]|nr:NADH-quinone oxidoreductase subunit C [Acidimicrobiia bacterium]
MIEGIAKAVPGATSDGDVISVGPEGLLAVAEAANEAGFEMCVDLTAVDYLHRDPRFEVVVNLLSQKHKQRLRVRCGVPADSPVVPSLTGVYPGVNFYEREVYDLMGISFDGHPDLTRILMPDEWEGHPLRKDYAVGAVPVQFKSAPTS